MNAPIEPPIAKAPALDIADVVARLADLRRQAQRRRYPGATPQLPSRQSLLALTEAFLSVVYPRHFSAAANQDLDAHVAQTLNASAPALEREVARELALPDGADPHDAGEIAAGFVAALPRVRETVDLDIRAALAADPSQGSFDELVFCSAAVAAILRHRLAHELHRLGAPLTAKIIAGDLRTRTGIDIHPGAEIGAGFSIANTGANTSGLIIGETAVIGRNVRLAAPVTLGERFAIEGGAHIAPAFGRRHPLIEDDVVIEAGASLFGPIIVGRGAVISRNAWVLRDVAPGARIERA